MIDADNDFDISDEIAVRETKPLGLVVPTLPDDDLSVSDVEEIFRKTKRVLPVLFTSQDDEDKPEIFDEPCVAEEFQRAMQWPVLPSVQEAEQWQLHRVTLHERREWERRFGAKPK